MKSISINVGTNRIRKKEIGRASPRDLRAISIETEAYSETAGTFQFGSIGRIVYYIGCLLLLVLLLLLS